MDWGSTINVRMSKDLYSMTVEKINKEELSGIFFLPRNQMEFCYHNCHSESLNHSEPFTSITYL